MIIVLKSGSSERQIDEVIGRLCDLGFFVSPIHGAEKTILGAVGAGEIDRLDLTDKLQALDVVEEVVFLTKPYRYVARESKPAGSVVDVGGVVFGGPEVVLMAGPCTVESEEQLMTTAAAVKQAGARVLRGGAYKPSTSPYSYQGMGVPGLELLREAGKRFDLKIVTEVMDVRKVSLVAEYADILQLGTRNMQNYDLLRELAQSGKPVLLKRGMNARFEEWLLAAEYIASGGNEQVILCERGIRTFETHTRNTLDLSAVPAMKSLSHLPVVVDPSQGTGRRELVGAMCKAAVAVGADGLLVEVHPNPEMAIKDGHQSLSIAEFEALVPELMAISQAVGRPMCHQPVR